MEFLFGMVAGVITVFVINDIKNDISPRVKNPAGHVDNLAKKADKHLDNLKQTKTQITDISNKARQADDDVTSKIKDLAN
ncbi:MAG: hypothetical protein JEZ07_08805 [Phycisphaerae bacterium]|nr:hypothetical protein [Phycisphaerae bacterium]